MRTMRKLVLMSLSALMLCFAAASVASADTLETDAGVAIADGSTIVGTSTTTQLTGSFFGFVQTVHCTGSTVSGPVVEGHTTGKPVHGLITSITFSGCTNPNNGNVSCQVTSTASSANPATMEVDATSATTGHVAIALRSANVTIANGCFFAQNQTCHFTGSQHAGVAPTNNVVTGTFHNPGTIAVAPSANNVTSAGNCGFAGKWEGHYTVTSGGTKVQVTNT